MKEKLKSIEDLLSKNDANEDENSSNSDK